MSAETTMRQARDLYRRTRPMDMETHGTMSFRAWVRKAGRTWPGKPAGKLAKLLKGRR